MIIRPTSYEMTVRDALLCLCLAERIHGTEEAVVATAYRVRDKVRIECRPTINRIIRCRSPRAWVTNFLEEVDL